MEKVDTMDSTMTTIPGKKLRESTAAAGGLPLHTPKGSDYRKHTQKTKAALSATRESTKAGRKV